MQNGNEEEKEDKVRIVQVIDSEEGGVAVIIPSGVIKKLGWEEGHKVKVKVGEGVIVVTSAEGGVELDQT